MPRETTELVVCFSDVCDSTHFFEKHGDDHARAIIGRALAVLSNVIEENGGFVVKTIGDEIMGTFDHLLMGFSAVSNFAAAIREDPQLADHNIQIRTGFCYGSVIREDDGDVFGDAVNVAARLVDWARPGQTITTQSSLKTAPDFLRTRVRSLGSTVLRGKETSVEVVEVLGDEDTSDLTVVSRHEEETPEPTNALVLQHDGEHVRVEKRVTLGRGARCDMIISDGRVSRQHASIEVRQGAFFLKDSSTNGTYVVIGNDESLFLHRDQLRLHGTGTLSLGRPIDDDRAKRVHFDCTAG